MKKEFDAEQAFDKMFRYMQGMNERIGHIDSETSGVRESLNTLQNTMDYLVGEYQKLSDEQTAETHAHRRFDDALADHETRIVQLENPSLETQAA